MFVRIFMFVRIRSYELLISKEKKETKMLQKESYPSTMVIVQHKLSNSSKQALENEKKKLLSEDNLSSTVTERTQIELKCSN